MLALLIRTPMLASLGLPHQGRLRAARLVPPAAITVGLLQLVALGHNGRRFASGWTARYCFL